MRRDGRIWKPQSDGRGMFPLHTRARRLRNGVARIGGHVNRYPRDMHGYGETPPDPRWPNGARIAVQIVLNYEEGGENNVLHGDAASEAFLCEIVGAAALARPAALEHGVDLRIRRPRRLLAAAPALHLAGRARHRLRRRHRARPVARSGRRDAGGGVGDRQPRTEVDRAQGHARGRGARADRRGDPPARRGHRRAPARLVRGSLLDEHCPPRRRGRRSTTSPTTIPTTCPTGGGSAGATSS